MVSLRSLSLERFAQLQSAALLVACPLVGLLGHPWPLALAATLVLCLLLVAWRGRYTPQGSFGSANAVTALRFVGVLWLATLGHGAPASVSVSVVVGLMLLDGLDGFLARRFGTASDFGAHFDVEGDALLVLVLGAVLWQEGRFGPWILWPGLLRYGYQLLLAVARPRRPDRRSMFARLAFGGVVAGLLGAFLDGGTVGTATAMGGALLVTLSFARSLYLTYQ